MWKEEGRRRVNLQIERVKSRDEDDKCGYVVTTKAPTKIEAVCFSVQGRY